MSRKFIRGTCERCGNAYRIPLMEVEVHLSPYDEILCWKCCREQNFWTESKCSICSEKDLCRGHWVKNNKAHLDNFKGI